MTQDSNSLMMDVRELAKIHERMSLVEAFVTMSQFDNDQLRAMRTKALDAKAAASEEFEKLGVDRFSSAEGVKKGKNLDLIGDVLRRLQNEMVDRLMLPVEDLVGPAPQAEAP